MRDAKPRLQAGVGVVAAHLRKGFVVGFHNAIG